MVKLFLILVFCFFVSSFARAQIHQINAIFLLNSGRSDIRKSISSLHEKTNAGRLGDEVFFSLKLGYHFPFQQNDIEGIPGGLVFDGSAEFFLGKNCYLGGNIEYWNSSNMISIPESSTGIERSNSATSFAISFKIRKDIGKVNIALGGLIGNCSMTSSSVFGGSAKNYFSIAFLFGFDVLVSRHLAISSQAEYRNLSRWEDSRKSFFEFKIGPSLILK